MNEEKRKKGNILIIILSLALIISIGYIAYDKVLSNNTAKEKGNTNEDIDYSKYKTITPETNEQSFKIGNERIIQSLHLKNFENLFSANIIVSKEGEVYLNIEKGYDSNNAEYENKINNLKNEYKEYKIDGYGFDLGENGNYTTFKGIKLEISDVIAAYEGYSGNGGMNDWFLYLLKTDGTISEVNIYKFIENNGKVEINNNINNLKNIYTIIQSHTVDQPSGYYFDIAIDKDGNEHIIKN